jgi:aspartyl-tRNA(Asn)/glutamyl-tRNA(Gln) amidotransferase subunit B
MTSGIKEYESVIGLEVHAQLLTASKMFCGCRAEFGAPPNSHTCPVCLGHPGALPVLNKRAVEYAIRMILAVGGEVKYHSVFARKNYFYPDLPKGYQISQYDRPIGVGGKVHIDLKNYSKTIGIARIHLEEDAAKLLHPEHGEGVTRIDFNRCGVPLIEIVSKPDIRTPHEARAYLNKLKQVLRYLSICSGDMEKGALRCDANVSLRFRGSEGFGIRTELKNLNSFKAVEKALTYEIERQAETLESGGAVSQATMLWDESSRKTRLMRGKEESEDYRYFPEPDLINLEIDKEWIDDIKSLLPELPDAKMNRIVKEYGIPRYDAVVLTDSPEPADYFEAVAMGVADKKLASNWVMVELLRVVRERKVDIRSFVVKPEMLTELLQNLESGIISQKIAREIFEEMVNTGRRAAAIIDEKNLKRISDRDELICAVEIVLNVQKDQMEKYRRGKTGLFEFFVGQVIKETEGKADPQMVRDILKEKLNG